MKKEPLKEISIQNEAKERITLDGFSSYEEQVRLTHAMTKRAWAKFIRRWMIDSETCQVECDAVSRTIIVVNAKNEKVVFSYLTHKNYSTILGKPNKTPAFFYEWVLKSF